MKTSLRIEQLIDYKDLNPETELLNKDFDTPMRPDAFHMCDEEKIQRIQKSFREIMDTLGLDLTDDSLADTPHRVAKMYVRELFKGLNPANKPEVTLFDNKYNYGKMLVERNITVFSNCEHHFVPVYGKAHVAYFSNGKVIGLSKLNRLVDFFARRPQVQERLTVQIMMELKKILKTEDVAVIVDAVHHCVCSRGVSDTASSTITAEYSGKFLNESTREELFRMIQLK
jgi:GTP cyclohydrolase I